MQDPTPNTSQIIHELETFIIVCEKTLKEIQNNMHLPQTTSIVKKINEKVKKFIMPSIREGISKPYSINRFSIHERIRYAALEQRVMLLLHKINLLIRYHRNQDSDNFLMGLLFSIKSSVICRSHKGSFLEIIAQHSGPETHKDTIKMLDSYLTAMTDLRFFALHNTEEVKDESQAKNKKRKRQDKSQHDKIFDNVTKQFERLFKNILDSTKVHKIDQRSHKDQRKHEKNKIIFSSMEANKQKISEILVMPQKRIENCIQKKIILEKAKNTCVLVKKEYGMNITNSIDKDLASIDATLSFEIHMEVEHIMTCFKKLLNNINVQLDNKKPSIEEQGKLITSLYMIKNNLSLIVNILNKTLHQEANKLKHQFLNLNSQINNLPSLCKGLLKQVFDEVERVLNSSQNEKSLMDLLVAVYQHPSNQLIDDFLSSNKETFRLKSILNQVSETINRMNSYQTDPDFAFCLNKFSGTLTRLTEYFKELTNTHATLYSFILIKDSIFDEYQKIDMERFIEKVTSIKDSLLAIKKSLDNFSVVLRAHIDNPNKGPDDLLTYSEEISEYKKTVLKLKGEIMLFEKSQKGKYNKQMEVIHKDLSRSFDFGLKQLLFNIDLVLMQLNETKSAIEELSVESEVRGETTPSCGTISP